MSKLALAGLLAFGAAPALAQAPNDAAAMLRRGKAYSDGTVPNRHMRATQTTPGNKTVAYGRSGRRTSVASAADHSADALNAQQLGRSGR